MPWWQSLDWREDVQKVTVAGQTRAHDDVAGWLFALRELNSPGSGLLPDLAKLADGQLPSRHLAYRSNPKIKIEPGPDLPKRIRLAHALVAFRLQTNDSTPVTRSQVDDWIDNDTVEAYWNLDVKLKDDIRAVAVRLEMALRSDRFKKRLKSFTPVEFMECVTDVVPILVQTGQFQFALNEGSPLLTDPRLKQIFDLFELAAPQGNTASEVLDVRFAADGSVKWGTKEIKTRSDADALKATIATPKKLVKTYKAYRDAILPVLILQHFDSNISLTDFQDKVGVLVKRSILPFYPSGALDETLPLDEFKTKVKEFDAQNPSRWRAYDNVLTTELDRAATTTGSILGVIDLYLAVEKIVSEPELKEDSLKDLTVAGLGFVDDGLTRLTAGLSTTRSKALLGEMGEGLKSITKGLSTKVVQRALFVFAVIDVVVQAKAVAASTSKAEVVGNSLLLAGSVATVGASGIGLLAKAGIITVAAGPVVVVAVIGVALGLIGWAIIALFHQSYPEQILRGCFFRKDPADRQTALDANKEAVDLRTGFVEKTSGKVVENLSLQIAYAVGLTRGFGPSAEDVTEFFGLADRKVKYTLARTPNSSSPPSSAADVAFARSISFLNMDLDAHGQGVFGTPEQKIKEELFTNFNIPFSMPTLDDKEPPLEFEVRTTFKRETITFEPMQREIQRWLAQNVVEAGGTAPAWQPGPPEMLEIRERAKAS
jgi:hypothetical protein